MLVFTSLGRGRYEARNGRVTYRVESVGKLKNGATIYEATASTPRHTLYRREKVPSLILAKQHLRDFDDTLPATETRP